MVNRRLLMGVLLMLIAVSPIWAGITITDVCFHDAYNITSGGPEQESPSPDNGGAIYVFVRNDGGSAESFSNSTLTSKVWINGTVLSSVTGFVWARAWPETLQPGQYSTIVIKGKASPISENTTVTVQAQVNSGATAQKTQQLYTPLLRLGHVVPSQDFKTLWIILRNTDSGSSYTVQQVFVDGEVTSQCSYVSGTTVEANNIKIIKVSYTSALTKVQPLAIRVAALRNADSSPKVVGAFIRLTEPKFELGTYSGDLYGNDTRQIEARGSFMHSMAGPVEPSDSYYAKYFIRSYPLPFFWEDPCNPSRINQYKTYQGLYGWYVDDEPDINSPSVRPPIDILNGSLFCMNLDSVHPTMVNLVYNKRFQEYGLTVDHPSFDHYCQFAPLAWGGFFTSYSIKNAWRYTDSLKRNTEPLRSWCYVQGVSTSTGWSNQPTSWGIKVQFWSHILGGIKGMTWFKAKDESGYANQYNSIRMVLKEFSQVRNLALYGDAMPIVSMSHGDMLGEAIISEEAMVVVVVNASGTCSGLSGANMTNRNDQTASVTVPSWIPIEQIKQVTDTGLETPNRTLDGRTITFNDLDLTDSAPHRVFLIGKNDTTPPSMVTGTNIATTLDSGGTAVVSWQDAHDNYGVRGYKVYRNGVEIADTWSPLYKDTAYGSYPGAVYMVRAYDAAGNIGPTTLQFRIDQAANGSTVVVTPGTYQENINFRGKNIILTSANPDDPAVVAATIIQGTGGGSVVTFTGTENSSCQLLGFTIMGGNKSGSGGGIGGNNTAAAIRKCVITGNFASGGGGGVSGVNGLIEDCDIVSNTAISLGGGGLRSCGGTIRGCKIANNIGTEYGGGISSCQGTIEKCLFYGNTAKYGAGLYNCNGTIRNVTVANNTASLQGGGLHSCGGTISNCIVWGNNLEAFYNSVTPAYTCFNGTSSGLGNLNLDPLFAHAAGGDFHLKSQAGRWDPATSSWVTDTVTSRCIDTGNPGSPLGNEPVSSANVRVNMGAYGGTARASKTPVGWSCLGDINNDGTEDLDDFSLFANQWLTSGSEKTGDFSRNGQVGVEDIALFAESWLLDTN